MTPSERRMSRRENVMGITGNVMPCNGAWTFPSVGNRQGRFPGAAGFVEEATGTLERGRRERERLCACCAHLHRVYAALDQFRAAELPPLSPAR